MSIYKKIRDWFLNFLEYRRWRDYNLIIFLIGRYGLRTLSQNIIWIKTEPVTVWASHRLTGGCICYNLTYKRENFSSKKGKIILINFFYIHQKYDLSLSAFLLGRGNCMYGLHMSGFWARYCTVYSVRLRAGHLPYTVVSAPALTDRVFMQIFRLFLGQCNRYSIL